MALRRLLQPSPSRSPAGERALPADGSGMQNLGSTVGTDGSGMQNLGSTVGTDGRGMQNLGSAVGTDGSGMQNLGSAVGTDGRGMQNLGSAVGTDGRGMQNLGSAVGTDGRGMQNLGSAVPMDGRRMQNLASTVGTLPRGRRQLALARSSSSGDSSKPQRHLVAILKEDKETFGFEIQTIRFPHQKDLSLEVCTCVCRVQEESPAHLSGLQAGHILSCINGLSIQGFGHKQIVDLIKSSGNYLRLETVNGALFLRKMELETRLQALKQELHQRWGELRALLARERLLLHGEVNDNALLATLEPAEPGCGGCSPPGPLLPAKPRFSSESSSRSRLSSMTLGSEDSFYQGSAPEDWADSLSRQSSLDDDCVFPRDGDGAARSSLRRNRSISLASSGSLSPLWAGSGSSAFSSSFGTLPRKSRRGSVRKHLLRLIPGFHRAVEEEESRV